MKSNFTRHVSATFAAFLILFLPQLLRAQYCAPPGNPLVSVDSYNDLIQFKILNTGMNSATTSTPYPGGYLNIAPSATTTATLNPGTAYTATYTLYGPYVLDMAMWIDYNRNSTFDASEFIPITILTTADSAYATFTVPTTASAGQTRLRIMVAEEVTIAATDACTDIEVGEVEDYTVTIAGSAPCNPPVTINKNNITANSVNISWTAVSGALGYEYVVKTGTTPPATAGTAITGTSATVGSLTPKTAYNVFVRTKCGTTTFSSWSTASAFTTASATGIETAHTGTPLIFAYPNPVTDFLTVETDISKTSSNILYLTDLFGKEMYRTEVNSNKQMLNIKGLPDGIYLLKFYNAGYSETIKVVKH